MPAADMGQPNPLPDIRKYVDFHTNLAFDASIPPEEHDSFKQGHVKTSLPYLTQDGYNRVKKPRAFNAAVLENDYIKARKLTENKPILHLMARNCNRGIVNLASRPCRCANLTPKGCIYPIEKRPLGGVLLLPKDGKTRKRCTSALNIEYAKTQWAKPETQKTLRALVEHYTGQSFDEVHNDAVNKFIQSEKKNQTPNQWANDRLKLYMQRKSRT